MKPTATKTESSTLKYARQTLSILAERNLEPTPVNYAVWYHYVLGDKKHLNEEIDKLVAKKTLQLSSDVNTYLYNKYIISETKSDGSHITPEIASQNAQTVLGEIMQVIDKFGGDTKNYNQEIGSHVSALENKITDPKLKDMAKDIITRALAIRDSSVAMNGKLEESRHEVVQLKTTLEKVTKEANLDFLTGTGNRKALEAKLDEMAQIAKASNADLCLLMLDIDHFKQFNDKFGHPIGDEVLRKVARTLFESIKGKDFVARYGGEEFAILLPSTPLAGGLAVAENIRKNIAETDLVRKDTGTSIGGITISIGVARYRPESDSVPMLISRADGALYRSKMGGRNRVTPESFDN